MTTQEFYDCHSRTRGKYALDSFCFVPVLFLVTITMSCFSDIGLWQRHRKYSLTVLSISGGNVLIQKTGSNTWITGKAGMSLEAGEKIKTDTGATASVTFFDGSVIELNNSTEIS